MKNTELHTPTDGRPPIVLGQATIYDNCCLQSGDERLWIDPPSEKANVILEGKDKVFLTHIPKDWGVFQNKAEVLLGEQDKHLLSEKENHYFHLFRQEGFPDVEEVPSEYALNFSDGKESKVVPIRDGEEFRVGHCTVRCVHTPGPTPGHTCLYLPGEQVLFAGSLFALPSGAEGWKGAPSALEDLMNSLEKVKNMSIKEAVFRSDHTTDVQERAESIIRYCYFRLLELYRLIQDTPGLTAYELAERFSRQRTQWIDLPLVQKWDAMKETLSHLNYLRERDYVQVREGANGLINMPGARRLTDI